MFKSPSNGSKKAFIPNNDPTKQIVNHIDGNKLNNHVSNLEWVSLLQNNKHAIDSGLTKITRRRVYQCDLDGNIIKIHDTIRGAGKDTNVDSGAIAKVCKGTRNKAGGFKWRFVDQNPNENRSQNRSYDKNAYKQKSIMFVIQFKGFLKFVVPFSNSNLINF